MTIEEKAKAYDEAIERARKINNGEDVDIKSGTTTCEYIFPELKESEADKIRKNIIYYIKAIADNENISPDSKKECKTWIAWLEQQDKKKLTWSKVDECMFEEIYKNRNLSLTEQIWLKSLKENINKN